MSQFPPPPQGFPPPPPAQSNHPSQPVPPPPPGMTMMPPPPGVPTLNYGRPVRNDLRDIAKRQRAIQICILIYILAVIGQFVLPPNLRPFVGLAVLAVMITATVYVFMLAIALYNTGVGILLGILTLVPLLGLLVLLMVNGKATNVLRQHGIQVGLLGANLDQIPEAGPPLR